ncbi:MAG: ABC transporter permease [Bryobacterales bacterium]|nr:ABC transporter permease [Bryobacterales bacterium]
MRRRDDDIQEELQAHYEALVDEGVESGLPVEEARRRARLKLGYPRAIVENVRDGDLATWMESWCRDIQFGARAMVKAPIFSLTAVVALGLGIGANTAVFTLLHGLLLKSLPVEDAGRLVRVGLGRTDVPPDLRLGLPYPTMLGMQERLRSVSRLSAWAIFAVPLEGGGESAPSHVQVGGVSGAGFSMLGIKPLIGRLLSEADDVRGGPREGWNVVLGYGFWRDRFAGDAAVIGRQIRISNTAVTIVGVTPPAFRGLWAGSEMKMYLPLQFLNITSGKDVVNSGVVRFPIVGRLGAGFDIAQAQAELAAIQDATLAEIVVKEPWGKKAVLRVDSARTGLPTFFGRVYSTPLYLMQGLVAVVLLLCCVNVAGLMMAKIHGRSKEFAIRTAIGAARRRLMRQQLTESFLLSVWGSMLGAAIAWHGTTYLLPYFRHPNEGIGLLLTPDRTVLAISGALAVMTTLLFGTLPAWRAGGADPGSLLTSRTQAASGRQRLGSAFVPVQVALSFALVSIAATLSQSLLKLETEETGFDLDHVTIQTAPLHLLNLGAEERLQLYLRMRTRLEEQAGVQAASFTWTTPMTGFHAFSSFQAVDSGATPPEDPKMPYNEVGPGYFRTMKTTILQGREFEERERDRSVCILNQSAAAFLFPGKQALGQYVRGTDRERFPEGVACRVVGLAQDAKFSNLREAPPRTIYFPISADTVRRAYNLVFLIHAPSKAQAVAGYRKVRSELSPSTPFVLFVTLREQMEAALGSQKAIAALSNFFAAMALFLSGLGLYGLLASSVASRTQEMGVRMALGADRGVVVRMILGETLRLIAVGLVLGVGILLIGARYVQSYSYGVSPFHPLRIAAIAGVLVGVAVVAGLTPALRAASTDPIRALRG